MGRLTVLLQNLIQQIIHSMTEYELEPTYSRGALESCTLATHNRGAVL